MTGAPFDWSEFGLWGICGGAATLGLEVWSAIRERDGKAPPRYKRISYWIGEACRILVGGGLAIVLGKAQQVTVPLGAFTVGVAAPLVLARLGQHVNVPVTSPASPEVKREQGIG